MPYTLKTNQISVKDPETGEYSGVDILAEQTEQGLIAELQAEGTTQVNRINQAAVDVQAAVDQAESDAATIISDTQTSINTLEAQKNTIAQTVASMAELGTDTTLSTPGMAADAKKTGDEISDLSRQLSDVEDSAVIKNTASGDIVSFIDGADDLPISKLSVNIEPTQNTHGYGHPWVGGAGKNLFHTTGSSITQAGVTYTFNDDGTVLVNGTATGTDNVVIGRFKSENGVSYKVNGCPAGGSASTYSLLSHFFEYQTGSGDKEFVGDGSEKQIAIYIVNGTVCNNLLFKPMIRLATEEDSSFVPYENICPIIGVKGVDVWDDSKVGGTVKWNQLFIMSGQSGSKSGISWTKNQDGSITINGTATDTDSTDFGYLARTKGHKYLMTGCPGGGGTNRYYFGFGGRVIDVGNGGIYNAPASISGIFRFDFKNGQSFDNVRAYFQIHDLTEMFGEEKADELYAMEQAEPGSGVLWFKSIFPNFYAYDDQNESTCVSAVNGKPYWNNSVSWETEVDTIYGGEFSFENGERKLSVTYGHIASYNGETLTGKWMSDRDSYVSGTTPTVGAEVAYELSSPVSYDLTGATQPKTMLGENHIWASSGIVTVDYTAAASLGVKKTLDAGDYGFKPDNTATQNAAAFQNLLDGGNKTIIVSTPGIYQLNKTMLIDDNTELIFREGVIIQKASAYAWVFMNRGAPYRVYNSNISIRGLHLSVNGNESMSSISSGCYGMRGQLSFLCTHNVKIYDFVVADLGTVQYAIQFNLSDEFIVQGARIYGGKDGVHISSAHSFVVRDCIFRTGDDFIALNGSDWYTSNCVDGDIYDGVIENIIVLEGTTGSLRMIGGAWVDWYSGITVRRSEIVMSNGNLYKVVAPVSDTEYESTVRPNIETYNDIQRTGLGFSWMLMEKNVPMKYSTNVWNITVRNVVKYATGVVFNIETYKSPYEYARTLSPDVLPANYPRICFEAENICMAGGGRLCNSLDAEYINIVAKIDGVTKLKKNLAIPTASESSAVNKWYSIRNVDFTENAEAYDLNVGSGCECYLYNCRYDSEITGTFSGRVVSDCVLSELPDEAVAGDIAKTADGLYVYKSDNWTLV